MNTLGTSQTVSDMNTLAAISGLNSLASNSANVTTVANNLSSVNNFAEVYRILHQLQQQVLMLVIFILTLLLMN